MSSLVPHYSTHAKVIMSEAGIMMSEMLDAFYITGVNVDFQNNYFLETICTDIHRQLLTLDTVEDL